MASLKHPVFASSNIALITGGASGVGFAIAKLCVKDGMRVVLVDLNETGLQKAKAALSEEGKSEVFTHAMDVGKLEAWNGLKDFLMEKLDGKLHFLVLNAGVGLKGGWEDVE